VTKFYRDQLEASGLSVTAVVNSGTSQVITAEDGAKHHTVTVMANGRGNETSVNVTYTNK
jgi:outer membrane lipopolysaccharide assembly protein LptE/RlpB